MTTFESSDGRFMEGTAGNDADLQRGEIAFGCQKGEDARTEVPGIASTRVRR